MDDARFSPSRSAHWMRTRRASEVCLTGILFERPAPQDAGEDAPPPPAAATIFRTLLKLDQPVVAKSITTIERRVTAPIEVQDLANEDRLSLERNLRWILARRETSSATVPAAVPSATAIYADAGAEHVSVVRLVESLEASGASTRPLLYSDLTTHGLAPFSTLIIPAGEPRVIRDAIGDAGAKALERFAKSGGTAGPLRGEKGTSWEGGFRVPGIFHWPGAIAPAEIDGMAANLDLYATFAAMTGGKEPNEKSGYISTDLSGVLLRQEPSARNQWIFPMADATREVRLKPAGT